MGKFMIFVQAKPEERLPTNEELKEMGTFNAQLVNAGIMLAADGLQPSSEGVRINFSNTEPTVHNGPFEVGNRVAGYWIWKLNNMDDAVAWAKKIPFTDGAVEIRRIAEADDLGESFTKELRDVEAELRMKAEENAK